MNASIRIHGTAEEVGRALEVIKGAFTIRSVSKFHPNREGFGSQRRVLRTGHVYVEVEL